ncbi:FAD-linked oxidoreductase [Ascodesmis nigricans]|uniref:Proline dehydrogenase n=1 Tax=Ascodesmis nigricans TaxID=341454 RepID=A0A4S2N7K7_9PEZI|nr:FAD-linked oxidoreductase [Ascodesmis nigricans]
MTPAASTLIRTARLNSRRLAPLPQCSIAQQIRLNSTFPAPSPLTTEQAETAATPPPPPLAKLSTQALLRGLLLHSVSASPILLNTGTKFLLSQAPTIERNVPLKWAINQTFYSQYCSGTSEQEIRSTVTSLRSLGISGIILSYAREIELHDKPSQTTPSPSTASDEISEFLSGTLKTISFTDPGDFIAIKYTGSGRTSIPLLHGSTPCTIHPHLGPALHEICKAAKQKGVNILIDAEQSRVQEGIDNWTLSLMRQYNTRDQAVVYNTYQMYTRRSPGVLQQHIALAEKEGWRLGVKLVRGAYLGSDPREALWAEKEETDRCYNAALEYIISGAGTPGLFPDRANAESNKIDLMVATHNKDSIAAARGLEKREGVGRCTYAQLMGMADELSLGLVTSAKRGEVEVYKYAVWGSVEECVKYLVRRAMENRDATGRSRENREAVWGELKRRWGLGSA